MTPEEKQQAHAEEIRQRTMERRMSPEVKEQAKLEALVATLVDKAVQRALADFTIQSGTLNISGSGRNMTIETKMDNVAALQPAATNDGTPYDLELCDGTIITVNATNVTPPA